MRTLVIAGLLIVGCQREVDSSPPAPVETAEVATKASAVDAAERPAEVAAEVPTKSLSVAAEDRGCARDDECTAILTQCSMCEGACTGVRSDRAGGYAGKLECSGYRGMVCNYDCRPSFKIEAPRCVSGRCESVRIKP